MPSSMAEMSMGERVLNSAILRADERRLLLYEEPTEAIEEGEGDRGVGTFSKLDVLVAALVLYGVQAIE